MYPNFDVGDWILWLDNRTGHVPMDISFVIVIALCAIVFGKMSIGPTTFSRAICRIKTASYTLLTLWLGRKLILHDGDLLISIPGALGWFGVMAGDLLFSCRSLQKIRDKDGN